MNQTPYRSVFIRRADLLNPNLNIRLRERLGRLNQLDGVSYVDECRYLLSFLQSDRYCNGFLTELEADTSVDVRAWMVARDRDLHLSFPDTEKERARICYSLLKIGVRADKPMTQYLHCGRWFGRRTTGQQVLQQFTDGIIKPLVDYLSDRVSDEGNLFYLIERFKMKCEWFLQDELYAKYLKSPRTGESELTNALRASLFDAGIDFPFSQPESPSGKADTVASLGTPRPLVLEVKVFDPDRDKRPRNLWQGFHQVLRYAQDYHSSVGYLVIFNCSNRELVIIPEEGTDLEYPTRIDHGGKSYFVITINLNPNRLSASQEDPSSRVTVLHQQLVANEEVC